MKKKSINNKLVRILLCTHFKNYIEFVQLKIFLLQKLIMLLSKAIITQSTLNKIQLKYIIKF